MTQDPYLLTVEESAGENSFHTNHLIEAENRQKVKYHFHRTLKDWGYSNTQFGKHVLENWSLGLQAEIYTIARLDRKEYEILQKHVGRWTKI